MRTVFMFLFLLVTVTFAQVSNEGRLNSPNTNMSINSAADWYTAKALGDISTLGSVVTVSVTWPSLALKGFYNPRTDSTGRVKVITQAGDTVTYTIAASSNTGKLPRVIKILTSASTDSLVAFFQYQ